MRRGQFVRIEPFAARGLRALRVEACDAVRLALCRACLRRGGTTHDRGDLPARLLDRGLPRRPAAQVGMLVTQRRLPAGRERHGAGNDHGQLHESRHDLPLHLLQSVAQTGQFRVAFWCRRRIWLALWPAGNTRHESATILTFPRREWRLVVTRNGRRDAMTGAEASISEVLARLV